MRDVRRLAVAAVLGTVVAGSITPGAAQICGDADDNGTVTVTDGVQALRAAAGLSNICGSACDVDGTGSVTVTDGVNILRKAAGLPITESCVFTSEDASEVVSPSLSIFDGITKVPNINNSASAAAAAARDCENADGTAVRNRNVVTFTTCQIGGVILDGAIGRLVFPDRIVVAFDSYKITRIKSGKSRTFNGTIPIVSELDGKRLTGTLDVVSSAHGPSTLEFLRILVAADGSVRQGSLIFDLTNSTSPRIAMIRVDFSDADTLPVTVQLRSGEILQFMLDRGTRTVRLGL
jgi:hypothetical protein